MTSKTSANGKSLKDKVINKVKETALGAAGLDLEVLLPIANAAKEAAAAAQESIEETILAGCETIARAQFASRFVYQTNEGPVFDQTNFKVAWDELMKDEDDGELDPEQGQ